jgi:glutamate racemase
VEKGADTIVLGCTHYPFLRPLIQEAAGAGVTLIDPAVPVARELHRRLRAQGLLSQESREGTEQFWTTGSAEQARHVIGQLWAAGVDVHVVPQASGPRAQASGKDKAPDAISGA